MRSDSVLNPGNQVAGLAQRSEVAELRLNLKAENEDVRLTARPIVTTREMRNASGTQQHNEIYFSRWQVQVRAGEGWNVAAGRDVLNWGPAQFRSPSSPFYFDNGRSDPMRELVGMDTLKLSLTTDMQNSVSLARIVRSGHGAAQPDVWRDSWLAKFDRRGDEWAYGLVALKAPDLPAFYGAHGQITLSDALMLYGEFGSSGQAVALQSSADTAQPFVAQAPGPRRSTALVGASHTFEDGKSLAAEYLHEGHGYTAAQESAYFQRATAAPDIALGLAPRLLGRDYLHLVWQSNLMDERGYWRLMFTRNLSDGGNEIAAYGETVLSSETSAFMLAVLPQGNARQEFSALLQRSVTLGLKIALPCNCTEILS
ncbi:MAG: hypothetical protein ABFE02_03865 [Sulfuricella sp.]